MSSQLLTQFKLYKVPVSEEHLTDWFTLSNPKEVEQVLEDLGITLTPNKVLIQTIVRNGEYDTDYVKLKLELLSKYVRMRHED